MAQGTPATPSLDSPSPAQSAYQTGSPAPTTLTGYGASSDNNDDSGVTDNGVLNYYFLLLAAFVIVVVVAYFSISRRRNRKRMLLRTNGQNALERDLEGWQGGRYWGHGRWRASGAHDTRADEGLDERGLPPPPYIPTAPEATHPGSSHNNNGGERPIPLQNIHVNDQKPPDYAERAIDSRDSAATVISRPTGPSQT